VNGTLSGSSFCCFADRLERRIRGSRAAFRKIACVAKRAYWPANTPFPARAHTTTLGPFGEVIRATGPMARVNPIRFSTKYQDDETGLNYYGYRYYDPSTGRWLNHDPIGEQGGINLYDYVGNGPVNQSDPFGLSSVADPSPFDPKDPKISCCDLIELIKQLARHVRGRYNDMRLDRFGLYGSKYYGKNSWTGHQRQFVQKRKQLRDAIKDYNDRGCGTKLPLPSFVDIEADQEIPQVPIRAERNAWEWANYVPGSPQTLENLGYASAGVGTVAIAATGVGLLGESLVGAAGVGVAGEAGVLGEAMVEDAGVGAAGIEALAF